MWGTAGQGRDRGCGEGQGALVISCEGVLQDLGVRRVHLAHFLLQAELHVILLLLQQPHLLVLNLPVASSQYFFMVSCCFATQMRCSQFAVDRGANQPMQAIALRLSQTNHAFIM